MTIKADFHIHSCLSPCGDLSMSPRDIAHKAKKIGLDMVALTDHNSALNCHAFREACNNEGIYPLFGLEITTLEELHCLALFGRPEEALDMGLFIESHYTGPVNDPDRFGDQIYLDSDENILGEVKINLTQGATDLSLDLLGESIHDRGGLFIPAHVDRPSFSIYSQLGFIPEDVYDALEITTAEPILETGTYSLIAGSDAHYIDDIGKRYTLLTLNELSFHSIRESLKKSPVTMGLK
jgi:PHP family Zn ribbon phosphoesterase